MAAISVTYTFTNGTTADANEVNTNFQDVINGTSDGTKDFSINALTVAGAALFNGHVTLGNSSSDDLTFTGSLASSIPIKTTTTYDIGSATRGLAGAYFGGNSQTVRLIGSGSMSATYTFTLPVDAGTSTYVLQTNGSGVTSWVSKTVLSVTSKTTTYTATAADDIILVSDAGGSWTLTLFAASGNTGKMLQIKKTNSSTNTVTIDANSSETIDGATTVKLSTQYEYFTIVCDGSNWHIVDHFCSTAWTAYTPTLTGSSVNPARGTTSVDNARWRRVGTNMEIKWQYSASGAGTGGTGTYFWTIPSGYTIATGTFEAPDANPTRHWGQGRLSTDAAGTATRSQLALVTSKSSTQFSCVIANLSGAAEQSDLAFWASTAFSFSGANLNFDFEASIPITDWSP